jgi:type II secretion system protein H
MIAKRTGPRRRAGFTMTELMVVLCLVGIIAAVSAPPMFNYIQSNRLQTNRDRLVADMQFARTAAISSGRILRFATTETGYTLTDPVSGDVLREKEFSHGLVLDAAVTVDFFPWGMANSTTLNLSNAVGSARVGILPTGIVEVY